MKNIWMFDIRKYLEDCLRLGIRDPRDVVRFLALELFFTEPRRSPFLQAVTRRILEADGDWSGTKRLGLSSISMLLVDQFRGFGNQILVHGIFDNKNVLVLLCHAGTGRGQVLQCNMGPRWIGIGGCQGGLRLFALRHAEHHSSGDEMRKFSAPPLPDCGISFAMKDRQNDDRYGFLPVVNAIWKALQRHAPNVYMDDSGKRVKKGPRSITWPPNLPFARSKETLRDCWQVLVRRTP